MKKYKAERYSWQAGRIGEVDVERETEQSVWISGSRSPKLTDRTAYCDNWEEAKSFLLTGAEDQLQIARRTLAHAQDVYGNIKGMKKP